MSVPLKPADTRLQRLAARRLERLRATTLGPLPDVAAPPPQIPQRQPSDVTVTPLVVPPGAEPAAPPPVLAQGPTVGEQQINAAVDRETDRARMRGYARLLAPPGAGAAATEVERILGANLPGRVGESFASAGAEHTREEELARERHPYLAGIPSDIGRYALEFAALRRVPGIGPLVSAPSRQLVPWETSPLGILGRIARAGGVEARAFGTLQATEAALERRPPEEVAVEGLGGAAGGFAFGAGTQGLREGLGGLRRGLMRRAGFASPPNQPATATPALLAPPLQEVTAEPITNEASPIAPAAGMPQHVAIQGAAQRTALAMLTAPPERALLPPTAEGLGPRTTVPEEPPPSVFPKTERPPFTPFEIKVPEGAPEVLGGTEPAPGPTPGEPGTLPQPREKKFAKLDDQTLEAKWAMLQDRIQARSADVGAGVVPWTRFDEDIGATRSGTAVSGKAGRAMGRIKDDTRILDELDREFQARGINKQDVVDRWIERQNAMAEREGMQAETGSTEFRVQEPHRPYLPDRPMPGDRIVAPATLAHGRVYRGQIHHGESSERAMKALVRRGISAQGDFGFKGEHGFIVQRKGGSEQFVTRQQAYKIAQAAGVMPEELYADVNLEEGELGTEHLSDYEPGKAPAVPTRLPKGKGGTQVREVGDYYSRVKVALAKSPVARATGKQWLAYFEKVEGGTSREELERTGLKRILTEKIDEPVDRELLQFELGRTPLKLGEHRFGTPEKLAATDVFGKHERAYEAYKAALRDAGMHTVNADIVNNNGLDGDPLEGTNEDLESHPETKALEGDQLRGLAERLHQTALAVKEYHASAEARDRQPTAYAEYTLPGGTNYREIIVTQPPPEFNIELVTRATPAVDAKGQRIPGAWQVETESGRSLGFVNAPTAVAALRAARSIYGEQRKESVYKSPHWGPVENPIGHIRLTDRTVMHEPTLFIEEVQSDVHQEGRRTGYRPSHEEISRLQNEWLTAKEHSQEVARRIGHELARGMHVKLFPRVTIPNPPWSPGHPAETEVAEVYLGPGEAGHVGVLTLWPKVDVPNPQSRGALAEDRGWVFHGYAGRIQNMGTNTRELTQAIEQVRARLAAGDEGTVQASLGALHQSGDYGPGPLADQWPGLTAHQQAHNAHAQLQAAADDVARKRVAYHDAQLMVPKLALAKTEDWAGLLVRRALEEAVKTGKTRLAWTTGRQQAERYPDLAELVSRVEWEPKTGRFTAFKASERPRDANFSPFIEEGITESRLRALIGHEAADRLLAKPITREGTQVLDQDELTQQLHVGTPGMSRFYDEMLPKIIVQQIKKLGGGTVDVDKPFMDTPPVQTEEETVYNIRVQPSEQPVWSVEVPQAVTDRVKREGLYLAEPRLERSQWLDERAPVSEADAAFGSAEQMELALDKAAQSVMPRSVPFKGEQATVLHYRQRAKVAREIADDLRKGQAVWIGREFPDVWPIDPEDMGPQQPFAQKPDRYREFVDGVGAMLQALRSPFTETLMLYATRGNRVVLAHALTSGIVNSVSVMTRDGRDLAEMFLDEAAAAGATHVHTAHNHPSGQVDPSGVEADIGMWNGFTASAEKRGMRGGTNLIIDDHVFSVSTFEPSDRGVGDERMVTPRYVPYHFNGRVPWFSTVAGLEDQITGPTHAARVIHLLGRKSGGYLLHMGPRNHVVGLDPFRPNDLGTAGMANQIAAAAHRYGATSTILALSDRELYGRALATYLESPLMRRALIDIVTVGGTNPATPPRSAAYESTLKPLYDNLRDTVFGRRIADSPMAMPWRGQPGYTTDPVVDGSRPIVAPRELARDGPQAVREALGPAYGEDELPNTASVMAQSALDAAERLGLTKEAEGTVTKLLTAFAGTRMEQIGAPLHLLLVDYERQRVELEQAVHRDIVKESLNKSAVDFLARLPYFNEYRAVSLLAWLRDKLPKAAGSKLGVTPDRQAALFDAAEAIAEFRDDGTPVFRDVLERTGELDQQGYDRLVQAYGHPEKLKAEVDELDRGLALARTEQEQRGKSLSPASYAVERYKLKLRAKQTIAQQEAAQVLSALRGERNAKKDELRWTKELLATQERDQVLDVDSAAALPADVARLERELNRLRADISRFEGVVAGRTPAGETVKPADVDARLADLRAKVDRWRALKSEIHELDERRRARWSTLRAFRSAYDQQAAGHAVGQVRVTKAEAMARWRALTPAEQDVVRRFSLDAEQATAHGLEAHVNRELAKIEYNISSDIEAYVHHYGFEDEGAMVLWFGSTLRRKKLVAGARQHRGGVEGFTRHLEGARLHGGLPLALQQLQNEFAEALERVMFTAPDPNLVVPLEDPEAEPPAGYSAVTGKFGDFKGRRYAIANPIFNELEFFQRRPATPPTTSAASNALWEKTKTAVSRVVYYWALNQLISIGTATRNFVSGAVQYSSLVAEDLAAGNLVAAQHHLFALAKALTPATVREFPVTEFGASQQSLRELDQAHGLFRALMNVSLVPFGLVENYFKRALTLSTRELEAIRVGQELVDQGTIDKLDLGRVIQEAYDNPTFEGRASEELVRDAFAYNYNNVPLALRKMNKTAIGKALVPFPIYGYKFSRHVGRYAGAVGRLARGKARGGDLQKAIAALLMFGLPAVLVWLGDEEAKAKAIDPGSGVKYDFDRSGRVFIGTNERGNEMWMRTSQYSLFGFGAVLGHTAHDRTFSEAQNYLSDFYSVGPGFQATDYVRGMRNRYQTYRNQAALAGDIARSFVPFHRPLETLTQLVDPTRRKAETFTESMLYAVPLPEAALRNMGLSRGEPRTASPGGPLVPAYDPLLTFLRDVGGVNVKEINPKQAQQEYRRAAIRAQARSRRTKAEDTRLQRLEDRRRQREEPTP